MLRHSLISILRSFKRFKGSFLINLVGLTIGLAAALFVYLWVADELRVDKFHANDNRLFQIMEFQRHSENNIGVTNSTPGDLSVALASSFPEVEAAVTSTPDYWFDKFTLSLGDKSIAAKGIYASKDFFRIFSFPMVAGKTEDALTDKNSMVISESVAIATFGSPREAIGKMIEFQHEREFRVTAVMQNITSNSSQRFDIVMSTEYFRDISPNSFKWENSSPNTFVLLKEGTDLAAFNTKIKDVVKKHVKEQHRTLVAMQFSDLYLRGDFNEQGIETGGRIDYVVMFSLIAVFILLIACINFMNLSTAKASRRVKDVGIRKAVGAGRNLLIMQYIGESMLMSFIALGIAVLMVDLLLPTFSVITWKELNLSFEPTLVIGMLTITIVTGLVAGSYPALYLSGFSPSKVLKGSFSSSIGELWARKGLVMFQFTLSVIFIVSVLVIYRQLEYLQNKHLGYNKDNIVHFPMEGRLVSNRDAFLTTLRDVQGVVAASSTAQSMIGGGNTTSINWDGKDPNDLTPFNIRPVNYEMLDMLGMELIEGRFFEKTRNDSMNIIFNETGIRVMGMKDPIGKQIRLGPITSTIVGVVKDFHFESLKVDVKPMFFVLMPQYTQRIMVKIADGQTRATIDRIEKAYKDFNPGFAFNYAFLDQDYQAQYAAEERVSMLSRYFASVAILISCLGLFGLAAFTAERRRKEIGIRKALGSSNTGIVMLLSSDFTKVVLVAIVAALPISFWMVSRWLDGFAYRIPLEWWYFVGSGLLALVIAWITVATQATRASRVNPVECLRNE